MENRLGIGDPDLYLINWWLIDWRIQSANGFQSPPESTGMLSASKRQLSISTWKLRAVSSLPSASYFQPFQSPSPRLDKADQHLVTGGPMEAVCMSKVSTHSVLRPKLLQSNAIRVGVLWKCVSNKQRRHPECKWNLMKIKTSELLMGGRVLTP